MRVSLPLTAESGRIRVVLAALCAVAILAIFAAGSPGSAKAALTPCNGEEPTGAVEKTEVLGSSLQKGAWGLWGSTKIYRSTSTEAFGCGAAAPEVHYESKSSGCGLDAMGAGIHAEGCGLATKEEEWEKPGFRSSTARIGATDFAPDLAEETNIDDGPTGAGTAGSGKIHVIPVASAAITVIVHFPEGCSLENPGTGTADGAATTVNDDVSTGGVNDPTNEATDDTAANETLRLHIPAQALEEIWEHKITEWGAIPTPVGSSTLAAHMTGNPTGQDMAYTCADAPIFRIARFDTSGTSYNFKAYLSLLPSFGEDAGTKLWKEGEVGSVNTAWPLKGAGAGETGIPAHVYGGKAGEETFNEAGAKISNPPANECTLTISPNQICRSAGEGGGSLASAVTATDGSIGYLDLATARKEGFTIESKAKDDTYWLPLQAINPKETEPAKRITNPDLFYEPTTDPTAHFNPPLVSSADGANCLEADYRDIPTAPASDPTLGDWSKAIATGGGSYPICAITYDLAFDDDATVYGDTSAEEAKARTVKNVLTSVTSILGQTELPRYDYGILPASIREDAQRGVAAIGWDKEAGGTGGSKEETKKEESKTPISTTSITSVVPSNAFSITSAKVKDKEIVLTLQLPDAGKVSVKATGGGVTVGTASASTSGGKGTVTLTISKAAQTKIDKAKGHKLSVKITVTFTPTGGTAASKSTTITLTQADVATKKATKKGKTK